MFEMSCGLCRRTVFTAWNTSTSPCWITCSIHALAAQYTPARHCPSLGRGGGGGHWGTELPGGADHRTLGADQWIPRTGQRRPPDTLNGILRTRHRQTAGPQYGLPIVRHAGPIGRRSHRSTRQPPITIRPPQNKREAVWGRVVPPGARPPAAGPRVRTDGARPGRSCDSTGIRPGGSEAGEAGWQHSRRDDDHGPVSGALPPPLHHVHELDQRVGGCGHLVAGRPARQLEQLARLHLGLDSGHQLRKRDDLQREAALQAVTDGDS